MTEQLKICHLADLHLGYRQYTKLNSQGFNQREVDVNQAFREAIDQLIRLQPDLVLVAGDLFHTVRPSNSVITFAFREFRRLLKNINTQVVIVAGNHDTPKRVDSGSLLRLFQEIKGVYISDARQDVFHFKDLDCKVSCLPHAVLEEAEKLVITPDPKVKYNVLVAHAQVGSDTISDFGGANLSLKQFIPSEWDYVALGHVHMYQELRDNVFYSGSLEYTSLNIWSELEKNKGFIEYILPERDLTFYSLTSVRELVNLGVLDGHNLTPEQLMSEISKQVNNISGGINGKIIKLDLRNVTSSVFRELDHRQIKVWRSEALSFLLKRFPVKHEIQARQGTTSKALSLKEELKEFCQHQYADKKNRNQIVKNLEDYFSKYEQQNETA